MESGHVAARRRDHFHAVTMCTPPSIRPGAGFGDPTLWENHATSAEALRAEFNGPKRRAALMTSSLNPAGIATVKRESQHCMVRFQARSIDPSRKSRGDQAGHTSLSSISILGKTVL